MGYAHVGVGAVPSASGVKVGPAGGASKKAGKIPPRQGATSFIRDAMHALYPVDDGVFAIEKATKEGNPAKAPEYVWLKKYITESHQWGTQRAQMNAQVNLWAGHAKRALIAGMAVVNQLKTGASPATKKKITVAVTMRPKAVVIADASRARAITSANAKAQAAKLAAERAKAALAAALAAGNAAMAAQAQVELAAAQAAALAAAQAAGTSATTGSGYGPNTTGGGGGGSGGGGSPDDSYPDPSVPMDIVEQNPDVPDDAPEEIPGSNEYTVPGAPPPVEKSYTALYVLGALALAGGAYYLATQKGTSAAKA